MAFRHLLLCYLGSSGSEGVLLETAEQCRDEGARLSVLVPTVDAPVPRGCCGIQGDQWRNLVADARRDELRQALNGLQEQGCIPAHAAVEFGPSVAEIIQRAADHWECDAVAVGRKRRGWSMTGLSRRQMLSLRSAVNCDVIELGGAGVP